jgi:hypothetical protein
LRLWFRARLTPQHGILHRIRLNRKYSTTCRSYPDGRLEPKVLASPGDPWQMQFKIVRQRNSVWKCKMTKDLQIGLSLISLWFIKHNCQNSSLLKKYLKKRRKGSFQLTHCNCNFNLKNFASKIMFALTVLRLKGQSYEKVVEIRA